VADLIPHLAPRIEEYLAPARALVASAADQTEGPIADLLRPAGEGVTQPVAAMVGVPFDTTTLMRPGARFGPAAVREALAGCLGYDPNWGVDLTAGKPIADFGDVAVLQTDVSETWRRITEVTAAIGELGVPLVVVGGDHGVTFPVLRGVLQRGSARVGLVNLDAHFDVRPLRGGQITSAMPFRFALEELDGALSPHNFVELGAGGWRGNHRYHAELEELGALVISTRELHRGDFDVLLGGALDRAADGVEGIWLSVDVDVLDAAFMPGTAAPGIAGLTPMQVMEIVWAFARRKGVLGIDLMELAPIYDPAGVSSRFVAQLLLTFVAGLQSA
jgi:formimidoylglutamase